MKKEPGIRFLFLLCWCSYFCAYLGRLNYSAALTDMIRSEGFGKGETGLIGTAVFWATVSRQSGWSLQDWAVPASATC